MIAVHPNSSRSRHWSRWESLPDMSGCWASYILQRSWLLWLGVERNRKAKILVCSETYWMSSGCHILMFNWSFFSAEIFHWIYFVCFNSFARVHFRKFCIIWNRWREEASQYRHHQNFSPTSIHWIQKCECLLHDFEYQIMLSVSVFVFWNSSRKWNHYLNGYTVLLTVSAIKTRHY